MLLALHVPTAACGRKGKTIPILLGMHLDHSGRRNLASLVCHLSYPASGIPPKKLLRVYWLCKLKTLKSLSVNCKICVLLAAKGDDILPHIRLSVHISYLEA